MMRLLVTGNQGQVLQALKAVALADIDIIPLGRPEFDLRSPEGFEAALLNIRPDVVVSSAALTNVDLCEQDAREAFLINAEGVKHLAEVTQNHGIALIHLSTDYVFDGNSDRAYTEADTPAPINIYGQSKLQAEQAIQAIHDNYAILRISWVYSERSQNFVTGLLTKAQSGAALSMVNDQWGVPTPADYVAKAIIHMAQSLLSAKGKHLFHVTGGQALNRFDWAKAVLDRHQAITGNAVALSPVSASSFVTPAKRPRYSVLDNHAFVVFSQMPPPPWQDSINTVVDKVLKKKDL